MLSVALDATLWDEPTTGIGLYTRSLAAALEAQGVEITRVGARKSGPFPRGRASRTLFTLGHLPRLLPRVDAPLFHAVANFDLPLVRVPGKRFVLTVHDVIPEVLPATVSRAYRWQFRLWLARSLAVADRVICVSQRTRDDLSERFGVAVDRLTVVPLGVDHVDQHLRVDPTVDDYLRSLALPEQFALYAGALDARKNVELVLDALERLFEQGRSPTLVMMGQRWFGSAPTERRVAELKSRGLDIRVLGYQSEPVFYAVMRRASVFVFPSRYEGFGLPPLEAMRLSVPAIITGCGALPEVCGPAAVQVDPDNPVELGQVLLRLLGSPQERTLRGQEGRAWTDRFTWARAAQATVAVYRAALAEEAPA